MENKKIFVCFGKNIKIKNAVVDYLKTINFEPVVLENIPGCGKTIIEKFESCTDCYKAIVIFSGDDLIKPYGCRNQKNVARQNVVFEFGYFIGKLGRENVISVVDTPESKSLISDVSGMEYIKYDKKGNWKQKLFKELYENA